MYPIHIFKITLYSFLLILTSLNPNHSTAQEYPYKPIKLIIPFAPGGGNDAIGRLLAKNFSESLAQTVIVENRAGAGGRLGVESGVKSEPDGYTLTLISNSYAANPSLYVINFDPINDITAIGLIAKTPLLIAVRQDLPVSNIQELLQHVKNNPQKLSYASSGLGGISHLATELFLKVAGVEMIHIPYKGTSPAMTDIVGGVTDLFFSTSGAAIPYLKAKKIKVLAVTTAKRSSAEPDIPTVAESGLPNYDVTVWYGLIGPKNLPVNIQQRLNRELNNALKDPITIAIFKTTGDESAPGTSSEFKSTIQQEITQWKRVVLASKIQVQ